MEAKWLEIFEDLLSDEFSKKRSDELRDQINNDAELSDLFRKFQAGKSLIGAKIEKENQDRIQNILIRVNNPAFDHKEVSDKTPSSLWISQNWLSIAASITLLLLIIGFFTTRNQYTNSSISDQLVNVEEIKIDRMLGTSDEAQITLARKAIERKDFHSAIEPLQQLANSSPKDLSYQFWLGQALLKAGKSEQAIQVFEHPSFQGSIMQFDISWHLAIAYLQQGQPKKALALCTEILEKSQNKSLKSKASELVKKLTSWWRNTL